MSIRIFGRYLTLALSLLVFAVSWPMAMAEGWPWPIAAVAGLLSLVGLHDLFQRPHSVLRNYPILGHIRFLIELIRPEIRQYLLEGDDEQLPFSRSQRSLVYRRAKNVSGDKPFGTLMDVYRDGYEYIGQSSRPAPPADIASFRITIGGDACRQPYSASVMNISAMSFGSLSANAIRALNHGAKMGGFIQDTGEGGLSVHHRVFGGDLTWELGSGYFGCRTDDGRFDPEQFAKQAGDDQVKMIEIKLSQGAKPGHGGILPAAKVSPEIAAARGVPIGLDCISPARHSAFSTPIEMMRFVAQLRELSCGKPVGFKLCLGHPWEFMSIVKAMLETNILPDFIVIDGGEGGTGAAPAEFADHIGTPLRDGLLFVHNTLVGAGLRDKIHIGASGKVISAFDIASVLALGADWVNCARGFMFAVGCIQSLSCHTNRCPTGVATQDPVTQRALVVEDKAHRVANFHRNTLKALAEILAAAGLVHPEELGPHHLARRVSATEIKLYSELYPFLGTGELLTGASRNRFYRASWDMASADTFDAHEVA